MIMSKVGRLPGSSFMQILMSLAMWGETPGETVSRSPSVAIYNMTGAARIQTRLCGSPPACRPPWGRDLRRVPPWWPAPTAALRSSTYPPPGC